MIVSTIIASVILTLAVQCVADEGVPLGRSFLQQRKLHTPASLTSAQVAKLSSLSNITHMNEILHNICVVRVVGTPQHTAVKNYIKNALTDLNWAVESDEFEDDTPVFGRLKFENIIARLNPNAKRYLALACHYDSKYFRERNFVGATDSAVPCAQLINLAQVMNDSLQSIRNNDVSLMLIFFDGEEAFHTWGPKDSIYGARHLAKLWDKSQSVYNGEVISELDKLDMLVLLDLIGAPDPTFYSFFKNTLKWYSELIKAETKLAKLRHFESYSYGKPEQKYFQPYSFEAHIEDDHIPFLRRGVPILHMIPYPFPPFWHKPGDNLKNVDLITTENINKILRVFVASYLHIPV